MKDLPVPNPNTRIGFHYFPDTEHYRESDLNTWIPALNALGASWLTLIAPRDRAIPEAFLRGLLAAGIQPILHFNSSMVQSPTLNDVRSLFTAYAHWGVQYVVLFDKPNLRSSWSAAAWAQDNLVERFLDIYLPLADAAQQAGLIPVFPPLEPGGDYWDTAFLRAALQGIQRRGFLSLLDRLVLGAYAWNHNRPLDWGAGGPERWPDARPYYTPPGSQDHLGFRIFDWYIAIAQTILHGSCHVLLFRAGSRPEECVDPQMPAISLAEHTVRNLTLARLMANDDGPEVIDLEPVPPQVLACNFWLLAASQSSPHSSQAWFQADGQSLPVVGTFQQWHANGGPNVKRHNIQPRNTPAMNDPGAWGDRPIHHYLLLPSYEWGIADWHLEAIRPFVKKYRPTVGFSLTEAARSNRVTLVGGAQSFPEHIVRSLVSAGCTVERIGGDGTSIASKLATL